MRRLIVLGILAVAMAMCGQAAPPACVNGTLASYIALGTVGCSVGSVTFANFSYAAKSSGGAPKIPASKIILSPSFQVPSTGGFMFAAMWGVKQGQTQESIIKYTAVGNATSSGELMLALGTHAVGAGGDVNVNETTTAGKLQVYENCMTTTGCKSVTSASVPFVPSSTVLAVTDDIKLSTLGGSATLGGYTAQVNFCAPCV